MMISTSKGFSLLELIGVIAVLGILLALAIPAVSGAQRAAKVEQTHAQFARFSLATEAYQGRYGRYPTLAAEADIDLNAQGTLMVEVLLGRTLEGRNLTGVAHELNPHGDTFLQLAVADLDAEGHLVDAFGNRRWHYVWDHDGNGWIELTELNHVPAALRPDRRLPAGAYWYVEGTDGNPWIVSW